MNVRHMCKQTQNNNKKKQKKTKVTKQYKYNTRNATLNLFQTPVVQSDPLASEF